MSLGNSIKTLRKNRGLKQFELSKKIGMDTPYLSLIENNKVEPSMKMLRKIASELETDVSVIFLMSIKRENVADNKKEHYDMVMPTIKELILSLFKQKQ